MAIPYNHGTSFDTARCIQCWPEYPFAIYGDTTTTVYHHIMQQSGDAYTAGTLDTVMTAAGAKPFGSLFSDDSDAYFVEDRGLAPSGNNLVTFDRIFANIPPDYEEGGGLYSFEFPIATASVETKNTVAGATYVDRSGKLDLDFSLTVANSTNYEVGSKIKLSAATAASVRVYYYGKVTFSDIKPMLVIYEKTLNGANYDFKARMENWQSVETITTLPLAGTYGIERIALLGRSSELTINSESLLTYRYVKTNDILSEGLEDRWKIIDATNNETDTLSTTTFPSTDEYTGQSWAGGYIQAEPEIPIRWLGNIWQIVGRKVKLK